MASPIRLPAAFDGMAQDFPRNNMPKGKAWNIVDYIPESLGAPLTQRGGWAYASPSLAVSDTAATYVKAGIYAPFTGGTQLLVIDDNSHLLKVVSSVTATDIGAAVAPLQNPVMHQQVVAIPSPDGSTACKKYDGTTIAALGATSPAGRYAAVFVNRTWLASTTAQPQRVYASDVGDPTAYAQTGTSASYLDVSFPVMGLAALPNVLLVFGANQTARFRGTTPPPGTDMSVDDPIFNTGCSDARSIAVNGALCCFANPTGVFLTNGTASPEDLTESVGIKKYWRDLGVTSSYTLAGGWFGNIYVISVLNGSGTFVDAFAFDVRKRSVYRISNLAAQCFIPASLAGSELYAGLRNAARVAQLSTMWTPGVSYKNDGDATAVTGVWETPFYETPKIGMQRWRDVYLEYDLAVTIGSTPTFTVSFITSPSSTSYTACAPTFATTVFGKAVARRKLKKKSWGMGFKVTRLNAAGSARLYGIGATVYEREGSRRS